MMLAVRCILAPMMCAPILVGSIRAIFVCSRLIRLDNALENGMGVVALKLPFRPNRLGKEV